MTLYRAARAKRQYGLSWTLQRSVAESIVKKFFTHRTDAHIYTVQVPRSAVLVCYNRRVEAEVLADLDVLRHLEIEQVA